MKRFLSLVAAGSIALSMTAVSLAAEATTQTSAKVNGVNVRAVATIKAKAKKPSKVRRAEVKANVNTKGSINVMRKSARMVQQWTLKAAKMRGDQRSEAGKNFFKPYTPGSSSSSKSSSSSSSVSSSSSSASSQASSSSSSAQ